VIRSLINAQVVAICDFCKGKPACVEFCPKQALQYISLEELEKTKDTIKVELPLQKKLQDVAECREAEKPVIKESCSCEVNA